MSGKKIVAVLSSSVGARVRLVFGASADGHHEVLEMSAEDAEVLGEAIVGSARTAKARDREAKPCDCADCKMARELGSAVADKSSQAASPEEAFDLAVAEKFGPFGPVKGGDA